MVPPGAYCYPTMLQVCLSLAWVGDELPIKGTIPAIKRMKRLRLDFTVNEIDSFEIAWDATHAYDKAQVTPVYPEEGGAVERTGELD